MAHVVEEARMDSYKASNVERFQFLATLDDRTSEQCAEMDLQIFDVKDAEVGVNVPPLHPSCRSITVPYIDRESYGLPEGTRAARDRYGRNIEVPASMSYKEWKAKYLD